MSELLYEAHPPTLVHIETPGIFPASQAFLKDERTICRRKYLSTAAGNSLALRIHRHEKPPVVPRRIACRPSRWSVFLRYQYIT